MKNPLSFSLGVICTIAAFYMALSVPTVGSGERGSGRFPARTIFAASEADTPGDTPGDGRHKNPKAEVASEP